MYKYLGNGFVLGVPARDLSEKEWRKLSEKQRDAARPLYERTSKQSQEAEPVLVEDETTPPEFDISTEFQDNSTQQETI